MVRRNKCVSYDHDHPDHRSFALILRRTGHLRLKVIEALSTTRFLQRGQVGIILILGFTKLQQTRMNRSSAQGRGDALGQACLKQRRLREAKAPPLLIKIMCAAVYTSDTSRAQPFSHGRRGSVLR